MGYRKVYTYDAEVGSYFYKNEEWTDANSDMYIDAGVTGASSFITEMHEHGSLFEKVRNEKGEFIGRAPGFDPRLGVTTIEEYFSWIKNLGNIDRKYTMLPLDEEPFDINANTRAITIPTNFKKNGIAVQGDEIAEVLYFRIDRYFDYMDFNNTNIYIQWEAPKNADGVVVKGISPEYVRDIESEPGKLIFGWALSDAITATAGTLKFSVRFYQWNDDNSQSSLEYNFSTLTASATVHPGLNYNLKDETIVLDDIGDRVLERLENSVVVGGYIAGEPVYLLDLDAIKDLDHAPGELWADDATLTLMVQAASNDAGDISYTWKKEEVLVDPNAQGAITTLDGDNVYLDVTDTTTMVAGRSYYYQTNASNEYYLYEGVVPPTADWLANGYKLFEKVSQCVVDSVGKYWVIALNRVGSSMSEKKSVICLVPRPTPVEGVVSPREKVVLTISEAGEALPAQLTAGASNTDGILTYEWYYDDNKAIHFGGEEPEWTLVTNVEGKPVTAGSLTTASEGHYKVKVINNRNKETEEAWTEISRVTLPAAAPQLRPLNVGEDKYNDSALTDENCPTVTINTSALVHSDAYSVQWFKWVNEDTNYAVSEDIVDQFKFNPKNIPEETFVANNDPQNIWGDYFAIITNHVNGSSATTKSERYTII